MTKQVKITQSANHLQSDGTSAGAGNCSEVAITEDRCTASGDERQRIERRKMLAKYGFYPVSREDGIPVTNELINEIREELGI